MTAPAIEADGGTGEADGGAEALLLAAMTQAMPAGIRLGCRLIGAADAALLLPDEQRAVTVRDPIARRASGAARHIARTLLQDLGHQATPIGRAPSGQPIWPTGVIGSLAHDRRFAVAAVAVRGAVASLGVDIEAAEPLPDDLTGLVVTPEDEPGPTDPALAGRVLFAAKEAVYKAAHPLDGVILNHDDIAVDLAAASARTRTGRRMRLAWCVAPRIVVLAILPGSADPTATAR